MSMQSGPESTEPNYADNVPVEEGDYVEVEWPGGGPKQGEVTRVDTDGAGMNKLRIEVAEKGTNTELHYFEGEEDDGETFWSLYRHSPFGGDFDLTDPTEEPRPDVTIKKLSA